MEIETLKYHLIKYAYCQNSKVAELYKDFIKQANDDIALTVYNHFQFYVFPFFIPKKPAESTNAVRAFFNKIRERFIWLTLYHFTQLKFDNYVEYYKAIDKMFIEFKTFVDLTCDKEITRIYNKIFLKLQREGHWLAKYDTINYVKINSLSDLNEAIFTYLEDASRLLLFINNKYCIEFTDINNYLKAKNELDFAYERHLIHGHIVHFDKDVHN